MNDIFDFNRFGKLVTYECGSYVPRFTKVLVTMACIVFALWITTVVFNNTVGFIGRKSLLGFLFGISCFIGPFVAYKYMNDRKKGYAYAMLPASTLEKFTSMLLICMFVLPMISYVTLVASDALLYLVSMCGVGGFIDIGVYNPLVIDFEGYSFTISIAVSFMASISMSMMFNSIFRKSKIIKTILVYMAVSFVSVILVSIIAINLSHDILYRIGDFISDFGVEKLMNICYLLCIAVSLYVTYRRIERVNY